MTRRRAPATKVEVTILAGAERMAKLEPADVDKESMSSSQSTAPSEVLHGVWMLKQLQHLQGTLGPSAPKVLVMPGRVALVHDRFVVIDDIVWSCGPSFNELGARIGLISRVHEPHSIIAAIERVLSKSTTLADWVVKSKQEDPQIGGQDATCA